ncbi:MAG TPA: SDR family NAD(P)-dependent oxidoreductase [Actinomycetaceae bacterium]|nr:SDR family NAD(P)-dependent oxidoreductase [Actinomycetaceae bacterium]
MGTALITGASSGLGAEFAWQLATDRHDLVLVARRADRLESLAEAIRNVTGVQVEVLVRDLADRAQIDDVVGRIGATERPVGLLVNNAGFGMGRRFLRSTIEREEHALDVMVRAVLVLTHAAARSMSARGRGAILNVSSMAQGTAMGSYAAHKAWVRAFTESLSSELAGTGVTATVSLPGFVRTEFHEAAGMKTDAWPGIAWLSAEHVVTESLAAVRRRQVIVVPSLRYKAAAIALGVAPRALVRVITGARSHSRSHSGA